MSPLAHRRFLKMNGLGNEITVLDLRGTNLRVTAAEARAIAADPPSRFDQLMVLHDPATPGTDAFLSIYNTDGSESAACGNGTRCVAWAMAADPRMARPGAQTLRLETRAGILPTRRDGDLAFTVDMGPPRFGWDEIPVRDPVPDTRAVALPIGPAEAVLPGKAALVDMGNPHAIFFVADLDAHDLARLGPRLERHPFFPQRANISLARVAGPERIVLRVWERGAGLTRACGSAACAAVVAAARLGLASRRARVALPGGELLIDWRTEDGHVLMSGPVELEHEGTLRPDLFSGAA